MLWHLSLENKPLQDENSPSILFDTIELPRACWKCLSLQENTQIFSFVNSTWIMCSSLSAIYGSNKKLFTACNLTCTKYRIVKFKPLYSRHVTWTKQLIEQAKFTAFIACSLCPFTFSIVRPAIFIAFKRRQQ